MGRAEAQRRALYEKLMLDGFQAGLSWITILRKRDNFRSAFDDFEPAKIARYNAKKVHALMNDAGIVRNRAKIEGAVASAGSYLKIMEDGPGSSRLLWDFVDGKPKVNNFQDHRQRAGVDAAFDQDVEKELASSGSKFVGPTIVYAFMQSAGLVNDHLVSCFLPSKRAGRHRSTSPQSQMTASKVPRLKFPPASGSGCQSGRRLGFVDPSPGDIEIADIAHGLRARRALERADQRRAYFPSVAQHTLLLVEAVMREQTPRVDVRVRLRRRCCMMRRNIPRRHDLAVQGGAWRRLQGDRKRLLSAIHIRLGLPPALSPEIVRRIKGSRQGRGIPEATGACRLCASRGEALRSAAIPACRCRPGRITLTRGQRPRPRSGSLARFKTLHP